MVSTIEQLKELDDNAIGGNIVSDVTVISFKEWLECLKSLLYKINNNVEFDYRRVGSVILKVDVSDLNDKDEELYNYYCGLLRKFFGLYRYGNTPKECWNKVVNNPDIYIEPGEYIPLK